MADQRREVPVHRWEAAVAEPSERSGPSPRTVADIMTRDLFTVGPGDVVELATAVMEWEHVRHVPVENEAGELAGLLSPQTLLRLPHHAARRNEPVAVAEVMDRDPPACAPDTPLVEAMRLLLASESGCVLVTRERELLGIVTERDFVRAALPLLEAQA